MKVIKFEPREIFIGQEDKYYENIHKVVVSDKLNFLVGEAFSWHKNDLIKIKFKDLIIKKEFFETLDFISYVNEFNCYVGFFNNRLKYKIFKVQNKNYLVIICGTEKQPTLFQIFVEAIIEFEEGEIIG